MTEIWKPTKYSQYYLVSNLGNVQSLERDVFYDRYEYQTGKIRRVSHKVHGGLLKPIEDEHGYYTVDLRESRKGCKRRQVHRLVAEAFIPNPENKPFVNHIDGNKQNNNVTNLEWCTAAENIQHAWRTGLRKCTAETRQRLSEINSKPVICLDTHTRYASITEAAAALNVTSDAVSKSTHRNGHNLRPHQLKLSFVYCSYYDAHIDEYEQFRDSPEFSRRHVRDCNTGVVYGCIQDFCNATNIDPQYVKYAVEQFYGFLPKYDILLRDARYDTISSSYLLDNDIDYYHRGLLAAVRSIYKYIVVETNSGLVFPTASSCEAYFNLPAGCVSESIRDRGGLYKKANKQFTRVSIEAVDDDTLLQLKDHYINAFKTRSGGKHVS